MTTKAVKWEDSVQYYFRSAFVNASDSPLCDLTFQMFGRNYQEVSIKEFAEYVNRHGSVTMKGVLGIGDIRHRRMIDILIKYLYDNQCI